MLRCPNCGAKLEIVERPMLRRYGELLESIEHLKRDNGAPPRAPQIAILVGRPLATVKLDLRLLESGGHVHRPYGPKRGWDIKSEEEITLVTARRVLAA